MIMDWISVKDSMPSTEGHILFVLYTPKWTDKSGELSTENIEFDEEIKVVCGFCDIRKGDRWWEWEDEISQCVIHNEISKEECGMVTYITHWMHLPKPPEGLTI